MLKALKIFLVTFLVLILVLAAFRHAFCRFLITGIVNKATGLKITIADLNLDIINSSLFLRDISLLNPADFKEEALAKAKEIYIKYDLLSFLKGRIHLRELRVEIGEIKIIKNKQGESNIAAFKKRAENVSRPQKRVASSGQQKQRPRKKRPRLLIDKLQLSLEKISYINQGAGIGQPAVIVFTMKEPLVMKDVTDLNYVVKSISAQDGFKNILTSVLSGVPEELFKSASEAIKKKIGNVLP